MELTGAVWGVPPAAEILIETLVRLKLAALATPLVVAVTVNPPVWLLAVRAGAVAIPLELVMAFAVVDPPKRSAGASRGGGEGDCRPAHRVVIHISDGGLKGGTEKGVDRCILRCSGGPCNAGSGESEGGAVQGHVSRGRTNLPS